MNNIDELKRHLELLNNVLNSNIESNTTFDLLRIRLAKSRAASRLVRTMAGDSRNMLQTWLD
ncbi:hypothetical protein OUZ56_018389 [Daphnia magna]|uniref:Uncharacterized protein n=1 Tax=Daphnia magna TaxID=35525 RepID=A0ABQ9Z8U8_9CRUS|nr:hypothetical protein OUZ56_018389 [Daphnia magna]